ncbi:MAG: PLP-dependent aminotransferase family protein, partial [Nonomuraea sp.]|nr:PLP-dependent aminotransferase family protein [Nonomuraea sp.]
LRAAVAAYLTRVRGVAATAGNTIVCAGFTQGFDLVCSTLQGAVALDEIGLQHRVPIIERNGLTPLPIPVDEQGLVVDALPESGVAAVLTTPAHQFPLGVVLAPHRREALMAWAARTGALVIEDDYDGEFRYDRRAVGSLQGRSPDSVVYLGSVSKTLAPALRLGWMVCPPYLVDRLAAAKFYADAGTAALDQLALARLIAGGAYDRHVRQSRNRYRANRQALEEAVRDLPLSLAGIPAGLQALATLPPDHDAAALVERAAAEGVGLMSAEVFRLAPGPPALVLGYGNITPHGIDQAMAVLAKVLSG